MALDIKNNSVELIGKTPVNVLQSTKKTTVIGLAITNVSNTAVSATVLLENENNVTVHYLKNTIIASGTSLRLISTGEKLVLVPSNTIYVQSNVEQSLDVLVSYVTV